MYAITGATGQLGRLVITSLLERVPAEEIIALARDPLKASDLAQRGVTVRPFDYDAPGHMAAALEGVTRLLLISSDTPDNRVGQHRAVLDAAVSAAVDFIAYTSIVHADANPISLAQSHRETELMIVESGLPYAILRNSWYLENYLIGADAAIEHGVLLGSTGNGRISAATRSDYAEAAAMILSGTVDAKVTYELAGDESFTLADVADALSAASGRAVTYRDLSETDYRDALVGAGVPTGFAAALAEYSAKAAGGILADDTRTLSDLIGRPTATLRDTIRNAFATEAGR